MKFSNGYWRMRDGVSPLYPMEARDVRITPDALTVYAPTKRIVTRGDTLNLPLLTVTATSPAPDVISIKTTHFAGRRPRTPEFDLARAETHVEITETRSSPRCGAAA